MHSPEMLLKLCADTYKTAFGEIMPIKAYLGGYDFKNALSVPENILKEVD